MPKSSTRYALLALLVIFSVVGSACGTSTSDEETIATSVALTVQAQAAQPTVAVASPTPFVTLTPPTLPTSAIPATASPHPTSAPPAQGEQACMSASLVDETIPDGTVMTPGKQFTKIWKIQNTSTCTWNTSYKIVFWDGDVMGGGYVYNFPQQALPGDIVDVPVVLIAPTEEGEHQSFWKLQTPGGGSFGVGYDTPFWADIVVSSDTDYEYGITSVDYHIVREPETGCPANVFYHFSADITVNGPVTVTYNFLHSDGVSENKKTIKFTEAGTQSTVSWTWSIHLGSATNPRWIQLFTTSPKEQYFGKATFLYDCQ